MDSININKLKIFASSGRFYYVNATLFQDNKKVATEDDIENSTNYKMVCDTIISEFAKSDFNLLETITDRISKEILLRFPLVKKDIIEVEYNNSTRDILFEKVVTSITRKWSRVYIYCQTQFDGDISENRKKFLDSIDRISEHELIKNVKRSTLNLLKYEGMILNTAVEFDTILELDTLVSYLNYIKSQAKVKTKIDVNFDIIFFDDLVYDDENIVVPFAGMEDKIYILKAISELNPNKRHPISKVTVGELYGEKLDNIKRKFDNMNYSKIEHVDTPSEKEIFDQGQQYCEDSEEVTYGESQQYDDTLEEATYGDSQQYDDTLEEATYDTTHNFNYVTEAAEYEGDQEDEQVYNESTSQIISDNHQLDTSDEVSYYDGEGVSYDEVSERKKEQQDELERKIAEAKNVLYTSKNLVSSSVDLIVNREKELNSQTKLVLFDLDGTLIDTSEGITKSARYALNHFGIWDTKLENLRFFIGPPLDYTFKKAYGFDDDKTQEAIKIFRERYSKVGLFESKTFKNIGKCLRELKRNGYKIAVASSKPESSCRQILEYFNIFDYFDEIVGATFDGRISTKEEVLEEVFRRFKDTPRKNMCLIGDTIFDVKGAKNKGIPCIAVSYGFGDTKELEVSNVFAVCDNAEEIPEVLRKLWT
ncbi:HAD hydrolase-like protein [Lachnobacterium bovis]|uniref:HAD hydrolase-like protein n=1 Tax=Lachnobacterium bovis TaxID=140626 RepID=UPI0003B7655A|nr:HAD hydrolase-like protein [Lachnobacterium bovis]